MRSNIVRLLLCSGLALITSAPISTNAQQDNKQKKADKVVEIKTSSLDRLRLTGLWQRVGFMPIKRVDEKTLEEKAELKPMHIGQFKLLNADGSFLNIIQRQSKLSGNTQGRWEVNLKDGKMTEKILEHRLNPDLNGTTTDISISLEDDDNTMIIRFTLPNGYKDKETWTRVRIDTTLKSVPVIINSTSKTLEI